MMDGERLVFQRVLTNGFTCSKDMRMFAICLDKQFYVWAVENVLHNVTIVQSRGSTKVEKSKNICIENRLSSDNILDSHYAHLRANTIRPHILNSGRWYHVWHLYVNPKHIIQDALTMVCSSGQLQTQALLASKETLVTEEQSLLDESLFVVKHKVVLERLEQNQVSKCLCAVKMKRII